MSKSIKRRVVLIHPQVPCESLFEKLGRSDIPPLGILYLASALQNAGHEVFVFDLNLKGESKDLIDKIRQCSPDLVGLGTLAPSYDQVVNLVQEIRQHLTNQSVIVAGGADATARHELYLNSGLFDAVLIGEAENTIVHLCDSLPAFPEIDGIILSEGKAAHLPERIVPDNVPFPARHLLPIKAYCGGPAYKRRRFSTSIFTHRGCPYHCTFCEKGVHGGAMQYRSACSILEEICKVQKDYNIHDFRFVDDVFMINKPILNEFIDLVLEKGHRFDWMCCGCMDLMEDNLLRRMKRAGCYRIELGIESGNNRILNMVKKKGTTSQAMEAISHVRNANIETIANFILGFPTETIEEMQETVAFSLKLEPDYAIYFMFTPFGGAPITHEFGLQWEPSAPGFRADSPHFLIKSEKVEKLIDNAYYLFYFRLKYILRRLLSIKSGWLVLELARLAIFFLLKRLNLRKFFQPSRHKDAKRERER